MSETLKQIIDGVTSAQEYGRSKNANINPSSARMDTKVSGYSYCVETGIPLQDVEFDVAVTVSESNFTSDGDKSVGAISVSAESSSTSQNSSVSRIKFKVPILFPNS
ncbi:hypothetical protein [Aeromonas veronii]|uniref:hypothetical protein n=1 Tax=Aeromonas veronii TaxID=654 RepID=UPI0011173733|nr:hypothetical protein [Aeromonas veronii]NJI08726.1 hypothetical protein [Aeromonas veronii]